MGDAQGGHPDSARMGREEEMNIDINLNHEAATTIQFVALFLTIAIVGIAAFSFYKRGDK